VIHGLIVSRFTLLISTLQSFCSAPWSQYLREISWSSVASSAYCRSEHLAQNWCPDNKNDGIKAEY
jgi:hypothetical protein